MKSHLHDCRVFTKCQSAFSDPGGVPVKSGLAASLIRSYAGAFLFRRPVRSSSWTSICCWLGESRAAKRISPISFSARANRSEAACGHRLRRNRPAGNIIISTTLIDATTFLKQGLCYSARLGVPGPEDVVWKEAALGTESASRGTNFISGGIRDL
jgi:hypothetical protein